MFATPLGKIFINEFAVDTKKSIGEHRERHHIDWTNFTNLFHKGFLIFDEFVDVVNHTRSIGILYAAEQCHKVFAVKDRKVCKCTLRNAQVRLIQFINNTLEFLVTVIFRRVEIVFVLTIFLPEIKTINQEVGKTNSTGSSVCAPAYHFSNKVCVGR